VSKSSDVSTCSLSSEPTKKPRKPPRRKSQSIPVLPEGLTLKQQLLYISRPVTAQVLAELLGVSAITVYKRGRKNIIPCFRIGSSVRYDTRMVARWLFPDGAL
jgi:hypothetical protein